ncbi:MAG: hypothetical protein ABR915_18280 [Thermoguttaceae bacterium]
MKSECQVRQDERRKMIFELEHAACAIQELLAGIVTRIKGRPLPLGADVWSMEEDIERLRKDRDEWKEAAENGLAALRNIGKERMPGPDCLTTWTWGTALVWLKNHPEWSLSGDHRAGSGNQGWICESKFCYAVGATPEEAVEMDARL